MRAPLRTKPTGSADPGLLAQLARPGGKLAPRRTPVHPVGEWPDTTARSLAHRPADTGRPQPSEGAPTTSQDPKPLRRLTTARWPIRVRRRYRRLASGCFSEYAALNGLLTFAQDR